MKSTAVFTEIRELVLRNRQRARPLQLRLLRRWIRMLLQDLLQIPSYELGFHFVAAEEMAEINQRFLQHTGSTDVITFDYNDPDRTGPLSGELFISVDDALLQARQFRVTWQAELMRYIIHGVLHLQGYDDLQPELRREMKREENRLLREATRLFPLEQIEAAQESRPASTRRKTPRSAKKT